jgi:hypothetical protein
VNRLQEIGDTPTLSGNVSTCYLSKVYYVAQPKSVDRRWQSHQGRFDIRLKPLQRFAQKHVRERSYWTIYELPAIALASQRRAVLFALPRIFTGPGDLRALRRLKYLPNTLSECYGVLRPILDSCDAFSTSAKEATVAHFPFCAYRLKTYYGNPTWRTRSYEPTLRGVLDATHRISELLQASL